MTKTELALKEVVRRAQNALGGLPRLQAITTYQAEIHRSSRSPSGEYKTYVCRVYRAKGGRIRIEEEYADGLFVIRVVNGLEGSRIVHQPGESSESVSELSLDEMLTMQRDIKISPRIFLAHADEYDLRYRGAEEIDRLVGPCLELHEEGAKYCLDPSSFLCMRMFDAVNDSLWAFDEYRFVDEVCTPHHVTVSKKSGHVCEDDVRMSRYNLPIPDAFFSLDT
jgi:hypothetical protein